ncbi:MAG: polyprenyl diphosphate synthase [Brevinema sp.]
MNPLNHIAIIPDGNRRWAKQHLLPDAKGHEAGFETLRILLKECRELGPKILSFYAFSTENFKREQKEIQQLFSLLEQVLDQFAQELTKNNIQLRVSGSQNNLPSKLIKKLNSAVQQCSQGDFILNICFNYGAQEEFINIGKEILRTAHTLKEEDITAEYIQSHLWNGDLPPVDLLIRTSGEYRISNFMLWQCAYAEFYFSDKLWPDFNAQDLSKALKEFHDRQRRYGT